jgi:deoxyribonuclease V
VIAPDDEPVAAWLCTRDGVRPVVVHAGWRTDVATAIEIALAFSTVARTPEPLRQARRLAREERAQVEGR